MMKRKRSAKIGGWQRLLLAAVYRWFCPTLAMAVLLLLVVELRLWPDDRPSPGKQGSNEDLFQAIHVQPINDSTLVRKNDKRKLLDNLSMPTRKVRGHVEPCLKLLPDERIEQLQLPPKRTNSIGDFRYAKMVGSSVQEGMDMFTGNQTMAERDDSFKVRANMEVHCGFYAQGSGFDIDEKDKAFMNTCEAAVSTCIFGGGDDLYPPIGMTNASLAKVCYTAFWDEVTLTEMAEDKRPHEETRMVGVWRVVVVRNLPFTDQRRNGKIPKMLAHRLFPQARYSIWVDSKYQFRRDPMAVFEALLWGPQAALAISEHGARKCVYKEGVAVVEKHKALPAEVEVQLNHYRAEGFPENATFNGHKALAEASVIVREHSPITNLFMCLWFNEVVRFTARDQLSFPYVLRQFGLLQVNMFPVCTRRALVNSIGHKQKAKQLDQISAS